MEIEQIYLVGDFSVGTYGEFTELDRDACRYSGEFVIEKPKTQIKLSNIERQGFPFFAGEITVSKKFSSNSEKIQIDFEKYGVNVVKAKINGKPVSEYMWEPYETDISELIKDKKVNEIELTLVNNLRNMQGPFHLQQGESYLVTPSDFYKEKCIWCNSTEDNRWNDDYCFACVGIKNRFRTR